MLVDHYGPMTVSKTMLVEWAERNRKIIWVEHPTSTEPVFKISLVDQPVSTFRNSATSEQSHGELHFSTSPWA